ncbi:unnamed protein product [Polarella glacialis]|uniref:Protochlorophyllide reductase n=1 Tax=Polarella glacialis TaxID=89957 RepID=A0A813HD49_POLGL|nr:unnamed protein product [Polarella glacialis]
MVADAQRPELRLIREHGCHVFMGSRDPAKGAAAVASLALPEEAAARCTVVQLDACSDESVQAAACTVKAALGGSPLYAVVNNAGTGLGHGVTGEGVINTNFYGPKRVCDAFIPLLDPAVGRIANVGSGAGGGYVKRLGETDEARMLMRGDATWDELVEYVKTKMATKSLDDHGVYGLSKACVAAYTQFLAKTHPGILSSCMSPGFIDTAMTKGYGANKTPEEGTPSIRKCLFEKLEGNGWYYGSDGMRSPYHFMRNPGMDVYDGIMPF